MSIHTFFDQDDDENLNGMKDEIAKFEKLINLQSETKKTGLNKSSRKRALMFGIKPQNIMSGR